MNYNITLSKQEIEYILSHIHISINEYTKKSKGIKLVDKLKKLLKPIKRRSAKDKGRNLQKWVCERIAELFNIEYNQQDDNCVIHSREMGQFGVDIIIRDYLRNYFPFSIECKSSEQLNLIETIQQAKKNTKKDEHWIIVYKRKAIKNPIVIMDWDCFYWLNVARLNGSK